MTNTFKISGAPFSPDYAIVKWTDTSNSAMRSVKYLGFTASSGAEIKYGTNCVLLNTQIGLGANPFVQIQPQAINLNQVQPPRLGSITLNQPQALPLSQLQPQALSLNQMQQFSNQQFSNQQLSNFGQFLSATGRTPNGQILTGEDQQVSSKSPLKKVKN